jgi:hypothetical protein
MRRSRHHAIVNFHRCTEPMKSLPDGATDDDILSRDVTGRSMTLTASPVNIDPSRFVRSGKMLRLDLKSVVRYIVSVIFTRQAGMWNSRVVKVDRDHQTR